MSAPIPKVSLSGRCSVIDDNTLYVLSPDAFQSLPLKENATWSSLPTGVSVKGASCAKAVPNGDESQAALYVIGGTADDDSFGGMQRYFFSNQSWETLTPLTTDMKGRTDHSVAYLNDSSSILVYAGSQPAAKTSLSSQTFLISVDAPYDISSFISQAPPANQPILLPWDSSHAVMLGGEETNKRIFTFGPDEGWQALDTNLTSALPTDAQAALVSGSDGSRVLGVFDASKSPNEITQLVLLGAGGKTASSGQTVGSSSSSSRKRKRDLTLSNWPDYNSTNAPSTERSSYSVAQSSNGLAVISGGSDDEPLNIFNQQKNAWVDNKAFFSGTDQVPLTSTTASATSSATASATTSEAAATSTEPAGVKQATSNHTRRTLGITLGVLAGVAVLFIAALLYMKWRKNRKKQEQAKFADEKNADRMSFADRGASFMKEAGGSMGGSSLAGFSTMAPPSRQHFHHDSQSSIAMFGGKSGTGGAGAKAPLTQDAPLAAPRFNHAQHDSQGSIAMFGGAKVNAAGGDSAQDGSRAAPPMSSLAPPSHAFHDGSNNSHSSLAIIAGKFGRHSRNVDEKGSFESTARLVRSPSVEAGDERGMELNEISNTSTSPIINRKPVGVQTAPTGAVIYEQQSAQPSPLEVKKRSSGWSKYWAPNDDAAYQPAHQNSSNFSVSQYTASQAPSRVPSALVPPLHFDKDVEAQRYSAVAKGRPSFNHSAEDLAARGASLDSVRPQTAVFHTGHSLEPESFLGGGRDSFDSRDSRRHSSDSVSSRIMSSAFFSHNGAMSSVASPWTPMSHGMQAKSIDGNNGAGIKEIHVPPGTSPRIGQLQAGDSSFGFVRPPSSAYSASIAPGRDSRMPLSADDLPGRALSPPIQGPPSIHIPGPAARAAQKGAGNSGFFPGNKDSYTRPAARKIGGLHPGTIAAISGSGISATDLEHGKVRRLDPDGANRDSDATIWPSADDANRTPSSRFMQEKERLMREKAEKEMAAEAEKKARMGGMSERERVEKQVREARERELREGTGTGDSAMSGLSEYSWLNLGAQK